jgi:hypothetical protein
MHYFPRIAITLAHGRFDFLRLTTRRVIAAPIASTTRLTMIRVSIARLLVSAAAIARLLELAHGRVNFFHPTTDHTTARLWVVVIPVRRIYPSIISEPWLAHGREHGGVLESFPRDKRGIDFVVERLPQTIAGIVGRTRVAVNGAVILHVFAKRFHDLRHEGQQAGAVWFSHTVRLLLTNSSRAI